MTNHNGLFERIREALRFGERNTCTLHQEDKFGQALADLDAFIANFPDKKSINHQYQGSYCSGLQVMKYNRDVSELLSQAMEKADDR